jgi:hypothetical protein
MDSYINQQKKKSGGTSFIQLQTRRAIYLRVYLHLWGSESDRKESDRKGHFLPIFSPL